MNKSLYAALLLLFSCQARVQEEPIAQNHLLVSADDEMKILIAQVKTPLTKEDVHRLDRHYPKTLEKIYKNQRLQAQDIINMTRAGVTDAVIIEIIEKTQSLFYLTPADVQELNQAGVSKRVISAMHSTVDTSY